MILFSLILSCIVFFLINFLIYPNIKYIPKGKYLNESVSPNKTYTVKTYLCNGGATVAYSIKGELIINSKRGKPKNIYWDYKIDKADITWIDDNIVSINGHKIKLPYGEYDYRNDTELQKQIKEEAAKKAEEIKNH